MQISALLSHFTKTHSSSRVRVLSRTSPLSKNKLPLAASSSSVLKQRTSSRKTTAGFDFSAARMRHHNTSTQPRKTGEILNNLQKEQDYRMQLAARLPVPAALINDRVEQAIVRHFPSLPEGVDPLSIGVYLPAQGGLGSQYLLLTELLARRITGEALLSTTCPHCEFYVRTSSGSGETLHTFNNAPTRHQLMMLYQQMSPSDFITNYENNLRDLLICRPGNLGWELAESLHATLEQEVTLRSNIDLNYLRYHRMVKHLPVLKFGETNTCWPGIYHLAIHQEQPEEDLMLSGYLALAERPALSRPGRMMLWHPGEPTLFFNSYRQLAKHLSNADLAPWGFKLKPVERHPALQLVDDFIAEQVTRVRKRLSFLLLPSQTETPLKKRIARLNDACTPGYAWLDLSRLFTALTEASAEHSLYRWFNAPNGGERRKNWLKTLQQLHTIPSRHALPRVQGRISAEGIRLFAKKRVEQTAREIFNVTLDADKAELRISTVVASTSVLGHLGRPISQTQDMTLTEWSLQNIGWLDRGHSRKVWDCAGLTPPQVIELIRQADVAQHYQQHVRRELDPEVIPLVAAGFRSMAYTDYIRQSMVPAANRTMDENALDKIITAIDFPDPDTRPEINGKQIEIWQLKVDRTPISETLIFCHPGMLEAVIYIPRSPDGIVCRTVRGPVKHLTQLFSQVLKVPGMRDHLSKRMATGTQDRSTMASSGFRSSQFALDKVTGNFYDHLWDTRIATIVAEIPAFARSTSDADRTSSIMLAKQISMLIASLVTPLLPTPASITLTLGRIALHTALAIQDFRAGKTEEGLFSLIDSLAALADGVPGVLRHRFSPRKMSRAPNPTLVPLTLGGTAPSGLVATAASEGPVWQNQQGQQYLNITGLWFKSKVSYNGRIIYHPRNRGDMYPVYYIGKEWMVDESQQIDHRLLFIKASNDMDDEEFAEFTSLLHQRHTTQPAREKFLLSRQGNYGDVEILTMVAESQQALLTQRISQLQQDLTAESERLTALTPSGLFADISKVKNSALLLKKYCQQRAINKIQTQYAGRPPSFIAKLVAEIKIYYGLASPAKNRMSERAQKQRNVLLDQHYQQQQKNWQDCAETQPYLPFFLKHPDESSMVQVALQRSNGVVIGQQSGERVALRFLIEHLPLLQSQGVKHLFLQHFIPEMLFADLQQFNQQGSITENLNDSLTSYNNQHVISLPLSGNVSSNDERDLMLNAYKRGISLHGLGLLALGAGKPEAERCNAFNFVAANQIIEQCAGDEKFAALVDIQHLASWQAALPEGHFNVTGLAPATQAASIAIISTHERNAGRLIVDFRAEQTPPELKASQLQRYNFLLVKAAQGPK